MRFQKNTYLIIILSAQCVFFYFFELLKVDGVFNSDNTHFRIGNNRESIIDIPAVFLF